MFTTGQTSEGAVNYVSGSAVCGLGVTSQNPSNPANATNLTLPQTQSCPSPIGAKWVAAITNWLCFAIDGAGLTYSAGSVCQNPLLLFQAIQAIINAYTNQMIFAAEAQVGSAGLVTPPGPSLTQGQIGQNFLDRYTENLWGPKTALSGWGSQPASFGNNRCVGLSVGGVSTFTKVNCYVQLNNNVDVITSVLIDPTDDRMANTYYLFQNNSTITHTIQTPVGTIYAPETGSPTNTFPILPNQILMLTCDNTNWRVTGNNFNYDAMATFAVSKPSPSGSDIICFFDGSTGALKKATIAEILAA